MIRNQKPAVSWYSLCPGHSGRGSCVEGRVELCAGPWLFPNPNRLPTLGVVLFGQSALCGIRLAAAELLDGDDSCLRIMTTTRFLVFSKTPMMA